MQDLRVRDEATAGARDTIPSNKGQAAGGTPGTAVGRHGRIYFVDYLRAGLVSLVILHHTAISYGGSGSFYYTEAATSSAAGGLLSLLTNFDQAWFLGAFFLLSGYFSPGSFDRKGIRGYLKDRLIRLGIPLLVFFFVLNPITCYIAFSHTPATELAQQNITFPITLSWQFYINTVGTGPLWFVEMLLVFELGYAAWRLARSRVEEHGIRPFPSYRMIGAFVLALTVASYLLWVVAPLGAQVLGFPSFFDFPQYLSFFIVGTVAARGDWLRRMPSRVANRLFALAIVASCTLLILAIIGTEKSSLGWGSLVGYGSLSSAFYALWSSIFAVGMTMFSVAFFRRRFDAPGRLWKFATQNFYAAYILQAPVITVVTAVLLSPVHTDSLLKFGLAYVIILPLTWGLAYLVRKMPHFDRVL